MTVTAHDIDTLARTIFGEARGEPLIGQLAVGYVMLNRAKNAAVTGRHQFGDGTIAAACMAPAQFDCWLESDPNRAKCVAVTLDDPAYQRCMLAALEVVTGASADPTRGALHYWAQSIPTPAWAIGKQAVVIGHQTFIGDA